MSNTRLQELKRKRDEIDREIVELENLEKKEKLEQENNKKNLKKENKKNKKNNFTPVFFAGACGEDSERYSYDCEKEKEEEEYLNYIFKDSIYSHLDR